MHSYTPKIIVIIICPILNFHLFAGDSRDLAERAVTHQKAKARQKQVTNQDWFSSHSQPLKKTPINICVCFYINMDLHAHPSLRHQQAKYMKHPGSKLEIVFGVSFFFRSVSIYIYYSSVFISQGSCSSNRSRRGQ